MTPAELSDAELVRLLRSGDEAAWAIFVERYSRYVLAIATRAYRLGEQDAEDVFQELFARAHAHIARASAVAVRTLAIVLIVPAM